MHLYIFFFCKVVYKGRHRNDENGRLRCINLGCHDSNFDVITNMKAFYASNH